MLEDIVQKIFDYAKTNGAAQVWKAWRDTMLMQGRDVASKYMEWPIPERDIELDAMIARAVIADFLVWLETHELPPFTVHDSIERDRQRWYGGLG